MMERFAYCEDIRLLVEGRVSAVDAARQERTAREILERFAHQPGVILADEVGMGKTFVALAVAVSVALTDPRGRPVVVMVPPSLRAKWPKDFGVFRDRCLPPAVAARLASGEAERPVDFLKYLDDPRERRKSLLFVTHGAMSRGLFDKWTKLAIIWRAIRGRHGAGDMRHALARFLPDLLQMRVGAKLGPELWATLLEAHPSEWLGLLRERGIDPEGKGDPEAADDPVPAAVLDAIEIVDSSAIYEALRGIPRYRTRTYQERVSAARRQIHGCLKSLWQDVLRRLDLHLPLVVLDEAHHLKNARTRLASLFRDEGAEADAETLSRGPLGGAFERMLFLTATPFQLGHTELCNVLERFEGIRWKGRAAPTLGRAEFQAQLGELRHALDAAQGAAVRLDQAWARLTPERLVAGGRPYADAEGWWQALSAGGEPDELGQPVLARYREAEVRMHQANRLLAPWVIRHLRPRYLASPGSTRPAIVRRRQLVGAAIEGDGGHGETGIAVDGRAVLPFLLAARATTSAPASRPVFAEGLASCYEAFLHTRRAKRGTHEEVLDVDDDVAVLHGPNSAESWYLDRLEEYLQEAERGGRLPHPKLDATVRRVAALWQRGEKVVVFCHYIATGRVLRQRISEAVSNLIRQEGARQLGVPEGEVIDELARIGERFFDTESPVRRALDQEVGAILACYPVLAGDAERLLGVIRRFVRTPSFLVRYGFLQRGTADEASVVQAMAAPDASGLPLRAVIDGFLSFLAERCGPDEREGYLAALARIQPGTHHGADAIGSYAEDELDGERADQLLPNVRLANGRVRQETRQRLMLTFNTPFYPEVLIASSVLAEGVDLHLNCRFVIHHDLSWNPSTLEQRTGRIDRIGAKCERSLQPVHTYLPFVAETQDEKQYRVVMDRERWFSVVMGGDYRTDAVTTEAIANRVPLPEAAAAGLAFYLEVEGQESEA